MSCPPAWSRASASWQGTREKRPWPTAKLTSSIPHGRASSGFVDGASPTCRRCARALPESGPLSYRRETTAELDELRRRGTSRADSHDVTEGERADPHVDGPEREPIVTGEGGAVSRSIRP